MFGFLGETAQKLHRYFPKITAKKKFIRIGKQKTFKRLCRCQKTVLTPQCLDGKMFKRSRLDNAVRNKFFFYIFKRETFGNNKANRIFLPIVKYLTNGSDGHAGIQFINTWFQIRSVSRCNRIQLKNQAAADNPGLP